MTAAGPPHSPNPQVPPDIPLEPDPPAIATAVDSNSTMTDENRDTSDLFLPDPEEVEEDLLHKVIAVNALTRTQILRQKDNSPEAAKEIVSLPYAEQLASPSTAVTHESDSAKKVATLLKSVNLTAPLNSITDLNPELKDAVSKFFSSFKNISIHQVQKLVSMSEDRHDCTYIDLVVNKTRVRAILDSGAPGNIISTRLVKKLKLAPDLDCKDEFGTAGPFTTQALGAYSSIPLRFGKLVVTAPAVVLDNHSYDILIGTSFLTMFGTLIDHGTHTFTILGQSIPMYYTGHKLSELVKKRLHYINLEYADGDLPVVYTL